MKANPAELEALAGRLRASVAAGRYREAQETLQEYCRALRKAVAGLPPGDARLHSLEDEWRLLLDQTRRRVLAGRAHAAARLRRLAPSPARPRFGFDGLQPRHTREWLF
jgi:hypothetical protein